MQAQQRTIPQRSPRKLHFAHKDMDYYYGWVSGRASLGETIRAEDGVGRAVAWIHRYLEDWKP
jgi:hypothetical protein